ncbi:hypothetical protein ILYODFUR_009558 [Ilyodon furcidens]|uniref:Uncharacterized protein n=1 Tax=Ilyodon furcidens TaxID=33524 RepID=A0ABV0SVT7_9TELE
MRIGGEGTHEPICLLSHTRNQNDRSSVEPPPAPLSSLPKFSFIYSNSLQQHKILPRDSIVLLLVPWASLLSVTSLHSSQFSRIPRRQAFFSSTHTQHPF